MGENEDYPSFVLKRIEGFFIYNKFLLHMSKENLGTIKRLLDKILETKGYDKI